MRRLALAALLVLGAAATYGQSVSTKQDIIVFRLSSAGWDVPANALDQVDQEFENVFVNIGRFNVIGMDYRLTEDDVTTFIERLRELKQSQTKVPGQLSVGKETFTRADLFRLMGSFVVVVPVLTSYALSYQQTNGYTAELQTSFTFISGESQAAVAHFSIKTIGVGASPYQATNNAASAVSQQLSYEMGSVPELQLRNEVIDVNGDTVLIELGRNTGIRVGDEFAIVRKHVLPSGHTTTDEDGLLIVKEVKDELSYAQVVYSARGPEKGDQLRGIPRIGFQSSFYMHATVASEPLGASYSPVFTFGTFQTLTRGFFNFRPLLGLEIPLAVTKIGGSASYLAGALPFNLYLGAELNWRFFRFGLVPSAAVGIGGTVPVSAQQAFSVSLMGGLTQIELSYLLTSEVTVFADVGYAEWLPLSSGNGWGGFYGGGGVAFEF